MDRLLRAYGFPLASSQVVSTAAEAIAAAQELGYPVVLKVASAKIQHKTDVGGVKVDLRNGDEVGRAFREMASGLKEKSQAESDLMIKEARLKAERLIERAQDQLTRIEAEISRAKLERDLFENRLRSTIEEHEALLDLRKRERSEPDNLRFLRRRTAAEAG